MQHTDSGLCTLLIDRESMPRYALRKGASAEETQGEEVLVKLHAWKGERHLGAWEMGRLRGQDAFKAVP